jgi:hypothetical protein
MLTLAQLLQRFKRADRTPADPAAARRGWSASDWARIRAPARHRDLTLSAKARRWLARFPDEMRPKELAERFPRIVNRLALLWRDEGLTDLLLVDLLTDTRGARQGFPPLILAEVEALYELHLARCDAAALQELWAQPTQC